MNDDSRFTEGAMVSAEVANRAINDALQFAPTPGAALSPDSALTDEQVLELYRASEPKDRDIFSGLSHDWVISFARAIESTLASRPAAHVSAPTDDKRSIRDSALEYVAMMMDEKGGKMVNTAWVAEVVRELKAQPAPVSAQVSDELLSAADAVVERWHSKDWKQPHTAKFISRLSAAVGAVKFAAPVAVAPSPAGESLSADSERSVDYIMTAVQEFASEWSILGGRFDDGSMLGQAEATKARIRRMLEADAAALATHRQPEDGAGNDINEIIRLGFVYLDAAREAEPDKKWSFSHAGYKAMLSATATKEASVQGVPEAFSIVSKREGTEAWLQFKGGAVCLNNIANDLGPITCRNMSAAIVEFLAAAPSAPQGESK